MPRKEAFAPKFADQDDQSGVHQRPADLAEKEPVDLTGDAAMELGEEDIIDDTENESVEGPSLAEHADRLRSDIEREKTIKRLRSEGAELELDTKLTQARTEFEKGERARTSEQEEQKAGLLERLARTLLPGFEKKRESQITESYKRFFQYDADGRFVGLRTDVEALPVRAAFLGVAEGFKRLEAEIKEAQKLPKDMANRRMQQLEEESAKLMEQYTEADKMLKVGEMGHSGVTDAKDAEVANIYYQAKTKPDMQAIEQALSRTDKLELKKRVLESRLAMVEAGLDKKQLDVQGNEYRQKISSAEAMAETLQDELKLLGSNPEKREELTENIKMYEGDAIATRELLKQWEHDEKREPAMRERKKALLSEAVSIKAELQAIKDDLAGKDVSYDIDLSDITPTEIDIDLKELNRAVEAEKDLDIPITVEEPEDEGEDVDLSDIEQKKAA